MLSPETRREMSVLTDALNKRAHGAEVTAAHTYVAHTDAPLVMPETVPLAVAAEPIPPKIDYNTDIVLHVGPDKHRGEVSYTDEAFIAALKRMQNGAGFMLAHLYDAEGAAQLEHFVTLARDVQSLAVLRQVTVALP